MENQLNQSYSHPNKVGPIESASKAQPKSGLTSATQATSKVINSSVTTGVKKEVPPANA